MTASVGPQAAGSLLRSVSEGTVPIDAICVERERDLVRYARLSQASRVEKIIGLVGRGSHRAATHEARELRGSLPSRFLALRSSLPAGVRDRSSLSPGERTLRRTRRLQLLQTSLADLRNLNRPAVARIYAKPKRAWHQAEKPHHFRPIYLFDWRDKAQLT